MNCKGAEDYSETDATHSPFNIIVKVNLGCPYSFLVFLYYRRSLPRLLFLCSSEVQQITGFFARGFPKRHDGPPTSIGGVFVKFDGAYIRLNGSL